MLIKNLLIEDKLLSECDLVFVFTNSFNKEFYINECGIEVENMFFQFKPEIIESILDSQEDCKKEHGKMLDIGIILDDCFGSRREKCSRVMDSIEKIWSLGRHQGVSIAVSLQSIRYCGFLLGQTDIAFFFPNSIRKKSQREFLKNEIISNYTEDQAQIDACFKNKKHEFTCVHLTSNTDDWNEVCVKGKVEKSIINFKIKNKLEDIIEI